LLEVALNTIAPSINYWLVRTTVLQKRNSVCLCFLNFYIATGCMGSYISNYHTITAVPIIVLVKIRSLKCPSATVKVYIVALNWPPQYNWNIVGSGVKYHSTLNKLLTCAHNCVTKKKFGMTTIRSRRSQ
jgi:hypothetical protein